MLIICNDLTTKNPEVLEAINSKDTNAIAKIASNAKTMGFNALELYAGDAENEGKALEFLAKSVEEVGLKLILKAKDNGVYKDLIPKVSEPQIIAPSSLSVAEAQQLFQTLFTIDEGWQILLAQSFGDDKFQKETDGFNALISKAEQSGIMPERIYLEALNEPLLAVDHPFLKLRRLVDAFQNIYPDIKFYANLPLAAQGMKDESILMNVFIGMSDLLGIGAYSFSSEHKSHLEAVKAADALLSLKQPLKDFVD